MSNWNRQGYYPQEQGQQPQLYRDPNDTRVPYGQQPSNASSPPQPVQYQQYQQPYYQQAPVQSVSQNVVVNVNAGAAAGGRSYFDGGILQHIGLSIVNAMIIFFSLGICAPWAICRKYAWVQKHTVIEGRRLRFDGTAVGLFGKWIKWLFLSIVTLGIYSFWVNIDLQKWITKHTYFDN